MKKDPRSISYLEFMQVWVENGSLSELLEELPKNFNWSQYSHSDLQETNRIIHVSILYIEPFTLFLSCIYKSPKNSTKLNFWKYSINRWEIQLWLLQGKQQLLLELLAMAFSFYYSAVVRDRIKMSEQEVYFKLITYWEIQILN